MRVKICSATILLIALRGVLRRKRHCRRCSRSCEIRNGSDPARPAQNLVRAVRQPSVAIGRPAVRPLGVSFFEARGAVGTGVPSARTNRTSATAVSTHTAAMLPTGTARPPPRAREQPAATSVEDRLASFLPSPLREELPAEILQQPSLLPSWHLRLQLSERAFARPLGGRLLYFQEAWAQLTEDPWVRAVIAGYQIDLLEPPVQWAAPAPRRMSRDHEVAISAEVEKLLAKKAIYEVPEGTEGFLSSLFAVPKEAGKLRPVVDLRALNEFIPYRHFKMEGIPMLRDILQEGDWMCKVDLRDAYLTVPVAQQSQPLLSFKWAGRQFRFRALAFGLASAPRVFTKLLHPVVAVLRQAGIRLVIYLDDILVMSSSRAEALKATATLLHLLYGLGFIVNLEKSQLSPRQEIAFLGFEIDSCRMVLRVSADRVRKLRHSCQVLLAAQTTTLRELSSVIGQMVSCWPGLLPAPLHLRNLEWQKNDVLRRRLEWDAPVHLSRDARDDLQWWITHLSEWNGRALRVPTPELTIRSDAASHGGGGGWGAVCGQQRTGGRWTSSEREYHINALELLAGSFAVQTFARDLRSSHVLLQMDNRVAVSYINKMGGPHSVFLSQLAQELWAWCLDRTLTIRAEYLPGHLNEEADFQSRNHGSAEWALHPDAFALIQDHFRPSRVDLFASRINAQLDHYVSWRPEPSSVATDAFTFDWSTVDGYAFPPFALIARCLQRVRRQRVQTLVLVTPLWRGAPWYPQVLEAAVAPPLLLPRWVDLLTGPGGELHPLVEEHQLILVAWLVSGHHSRVKDFQVTCRPSSLDHGGQRQRATTTALGRFGLAGVINGRSIPFAPV